MNVVGTEIVWTIKQCVKSIKIFIIEFILCLCKDILIKLNNTVICKKYKMNTKPRPIAAGFSVCGERDTKRAKKKMRGMNRTGKIG